MSRVSRPNKHIIGHFGDGFCGSNDPTNSVKAIRKVVNGHSDGDTGKTWFRQMAALLRRVLAEVCTVPVLLVIHLPDIVCSGCTSGVTRTRKVGVQWAWITESANIP